MFFKVKTRGTLIIIYLFAPHSFDQTPGRISMKTCITGKIYSVVLCEGGFLFELLTERYDCWHRAVGEEMLTDCQSLAARWGIYFLINKQTNVEIFQLRFQFHFRCVRDLAKVHCEHHHWQWQTNLFPLPVTFYFVLQIRIDWHKLFVDKLYWQAPLDQSSFLFISPTYFFHKDGSRGPQICLIIRQHYSTKLW